jgi:tRNA A37 methylthiotransferase MiaB
MNEIKKISLVQVNFQQGPRHLNAHYLPYSIGVIWSYANQFESIRTRYHLDHVVCIRDSVDIVAERLRYQDVVAFSCYVWNKNYNLSLAKKIKQNNPECLIIFGGPEPNYTDPHIFEQCPFIDIIVKNEGEKTFYQILDNPAHISQYPGMVINQQGHALDTGEPERINDLSVIPSPYLTGFFDRLIKQYPDVEWNATLETNRGCPYACTFCDWGSLTYNKIKKFDLERVFAEMEWIAENRCGFLSVTDANFGIFPDRDNAIIDRFIQLQKRFGYPYTFNVSWAKNQKKEVINIVKKLMSDTNTLNHGLTLSFQSFDPTVLDIIKRKNMYSTDTQEIFQSAEQNQIPVTSELILGLPGETINSWKENFWHLFRLGNHSGIDIFQTQLLTNAELNTLQRRLYGVKSTTVYDYMSGSYNNDDLAESVEIITETSSLPYTDMMEAQSFNLFINTFHIHGLSNWLSRFVYQYLNIDYKVFYDDLYQYLQEEDNWFQTELKDFRYYATQWMNEGKIGHPPIANIEIHGWNLIHRSIINMHASQKKSHIMSVLERFMRRFDLDQSLIRDLMLLQSGYIIEHDHLRQYPKTIHLDHNIYNYLTQNSSLLGEPERLCFCFTDKAGMSMQEFLEKIYYGRRRNFGKAIIQCTIGQVDIDS